MAMQDVPRYHFLQAFFSVNQPIFASLYPTDYEPLKSRTLQAKCCLPLGQLIGLNSSKVSRSINGKIEFLMVHLPEKLDRIWYI